MSALCVQTYMYLCYIAHTYIDSAIYNNIQMYINIRSWEFIIINLYEIGTVVRIPDFFPFFFLSLASSKETLITKEGFIVRFSRHNTVSLYFIKGLYVIDLYYAGQYIVVYPPPRYIGVSIVILKKIRCVRD